MRCVAEVSSFNLMYNLCMYYERQKSYDKAELTFQPTLVIHTPCPIDLLAPAIVQITITMQLTIAYGAENKQFHYPAVCSIITQL